MFRKIKQWFQKLTQPQIIAFEPKKKGTIYIPPYIDDYIASDIQTQQINLLFILPLLKRIKELQKSLL